RMADLADSQGKAADQERAARLDADSARLREATERARAEQALQKAEVNYARARAAVNDYLTAVSEDDRLKAPGLQNVRAQLLQSALNYYEDFLKEGGSDPHLRQELAGVYAKVADIQRELRQVKAAGQASRRARELYEQLVQERPTDLAIQHGLAMAY